HTRCRRYQSRSKWWCRNSFRRKHGNKRLADSKCRQRFLDIVKRSLWKGSRCCLECLVVVRRKGAKCMLNAVNELSEDVFVDILRTLCDEVNAHALRSDQSNYLLDLIEQRFARAIEDEVRLIEEESKLGLID